MSNNINYSYKIRRFSAGTLEQLQKNLNYYTTRHNIKPSNIISLDLEDNNRPYFVVKLFYWEAENKNEKEV